MLKRIGLVAKLRDKKAVQKALQLATFIESKGLEVIYEKGLGDMGGHSGGSPIAEIKSDMIVTLGGDGTVLRTCMQINPSDTPLLTVNMGKRGFLTEVAPHEAEDAISKYLKGNYVLEEHSKLSFYLNDKFLVDGLNEFLLTSPPNKLLRLLVSIGENELTRFSADGLIVSTPTGSTAHAFSAGGPILHPDLMAFVIVLLSPLSPIKTIVVPKEHNIRVQCLRKDLSLIATVDGSFSEKITPSDEIAITQSKNKAYFIRFHQNHFKRNLDKLLLRDLLALDEKKLQYLLENSQMTSVLNANKDMS